jgi:hypothetical protein
MRGDQPDGMVGAHVAHAADRQRESEHASPDDGQHLRSVEVDADRAGDQ